MNSAKELLPNTYRAFFGSFSGLTAMQHALIAPILEGQDIVLQAGTGSGKTEAVLAPATEILMTAQCHSTIIYIVPTRALALDMDRRITPIYERLGLKSGIRTGDIKRAGSAKPQLLIMTPESLDVLIGNKNANNRYFLKHTRILILDEIHIFLNQDRGQQLSFLKHRLATFSHHPLQTITLSATVTNANHVIQSFQLKSRHYCHIEASKRALFPHWVHLKNDAELPFFFQDLYHKYGYRKVLVFANSRKRCEELLTILDDGPFATKCLMHYSNLSTQERCHIEKAFRTRKIALCIATSTLELGIDIGDVDGIILIDPPSSTETFLQRIGRGNRRKNHIQFWGICSDPEAGRDLVRFLALFEQASHNRLESQQTKTTHSVQFQQILSCLYEKGQLSINSLHTLFAQRFQNLEPMITKMVASNWLKPMAQPNLYQAGWRYYQALNTKRIWSNFPLTDQEYSVILNSEIIAVVPQSIVRQIEVGNTIQLTGKRLRILQIEETKTQFLVHTELSNSPEDTPLVWIGNGTPIAYELAQQMAQVLSNPKPYPGLFNRTQTLLEQERNRFAETVQLANDIRVRIVNQDHYQYFTCLGSLGNFVLQRVIQDQFTDPLENFYIEYDELSISTNQQIQFESLPLPTNIAAFRQWAQAHDYALKSTFSQNSWTCWLPRDLQLDEIVSRVLDPQILTHFQHYLDHSSEIISEVPDICQYA